MPDIDFLPGNPSFSQQLGQALGTGLGQGVSQGLNEQLIRYNKRKSFERAGLPTAYADLDPAIVGPLLKQQQKNALIQQILNPSGQSSSALSQHGLEESPISIGTQGAGLTPQQRIALSAADPNIGRAAQSEEKMRLAEQAPYKKSEIKRSEKFLDQIEEKRDAVQRARNSLVSAEEALANRDLGFFSRDNLANLTGIQGLASPEGAVFNAAAKNFFLADLQSAVGRPNQFLEKILKNAVFDVGKSNEANEALLEFYKNQVDLEEEKIKITDDLEDYYRAKGLPPPGNIGRLVQQQLKPYAQQKEKELEKKFEDSDFLKKESKGRGTSSQFPTAINPKTGQRLILKDGKWKAG